LGRDDAKEENIENRKEVDAVMSNNVELKLGKGAVDRYSRDAVDKTNASGASDIFLDDNLMISQS